MNRAGVSRRVAVFDEPPNREQRRSSLRRGLPYEDARRAEVRELTTLGVTDRRAISIVTDRRPKVRCSRNALVARSAFSDRMGWWLPGSPPTERIGCCPPGDAKVIRTGASRCEQRVIQAFDPRSVVENSRRRAHRNRRAPEAFARLGASPRVVSASSLSRLDASLSCANFRRCGSPTVAKASEMRCSSTRGRLQRDAASLGSLLSGTDLREASGLRSRHCVAVCNSKRLAPPITCNSFRLSGNRLRATMPWSRRPMSIGFPPVTASISAARTVIASPSRTDRRQGIGRGARVMTTLSRRPPKARSSDDLETEAPKPDWMKCANASPFVKLSSLSAEVAVVSPLVFGFRDMSPFAAGTRRRAPRRCGARHRSPEPLQPRARLPAHVGRRGSAV